MYFQPASRSVCLLLIIPTAGIIIIIITITTMEVGAHIHFILNFAKIVTNLLDFGGSRPLLGLFGVIF